MKKNTTDSKALALHKKLGGKVGTLSKAKLLKGEDWALNYTPGVGAVSTHLAKRPQDARVYTIKKNTVAVISDGTAVLGLGDIGPIGSLPVLEGKALIFKEMAGVDAYPIALNTKDVDAIVETIKNIAPGFGGINLEDISAPRCFEIEKRLREELDIPVMHDDQHGTAIVVLAGLINACLVTKRSLNNSRVVLNGVGAAGIGVIRLLKQHAPKVTIFAVDSVGVVSAERQGLHESKRALIDEGIIDGSVRGSLADVLVGADIFVGLSKGNILKESMVRSMNTHPIIFALANPVPEIVPDAARKAGAGVVATGRSDYPNQVNNALVFPGVFRGALDRGVKQITEKMKLNAAKALAQMIKKPTSDSILPKVWDKKVVKAVASAIR